MRIERNIEFLDGHQLSYQVQVARKTRIIVESYDTYEEAVKARDEIIANYRATGKMIHSSIYENGRLKLAKRRYQSDDLKKTVKSGRKYYSIDVICSRCNRIHTYHRQFYYRQFVDRGQICQACFTKDRYNGLLETRYARTKSNSNNLSTGVKNVTFDRGYSKYRVTIERKKVRVTRFADTLNEAIAVKERVLDFYKDHDRLPTHDEV